jgi:hypothetical protein
MTACFLIGVPAVTTPTVHDSATAEAPTRTASIIPFPVRPAAEPPAAEVRLAKALASLNAALAGQRKALEGWRAVLGELKASTSRLDDSLQSYRANLRTLGTSVSSLRAKARSLEEWADGMASSPE